MNKCLTILFFSAMISVTCYSQDWLVIHSNGNIGIDTLNPASKLHVNGTARMSGFMLTTSPASGSVLTSDGSGIGTWQSISTIFSTTSNVTSNISGDLTNDDFIFGSSQLDDDGNSNHDSRLFFDKSKKAFRAGSVTSTQWDASNIGSYSSAMGYNTTASGSYSAAMGYNTTASGSYSVALGISCMATGNGALAMGNGSDATGAWSATAIGKDNNATGSYSTALGMQTTAESFAEFTVGRYNTDYTPNSTTSWNNSDRLFVVGNGINSGAGRSNAMVILKNGNVGIGTSLPGTTLEVSGTLQADIIKLSATDGSGSLLVSDANGNGSWVDTTTASVSGRFLHVFENTSTTNQSGAIKAMLKDGNAAAGYYYGLLGRASKSDTTSSGAVTAYGVRGECSGASTVSGGITTNYAIYGTATGSGSTGSTTNVGVYGSATTTNNGNNYGVYGAAANGNQNYAGYFSGNVHVAGTLSKSSGSFKIDHPMDPENQYLFHSFVESPDMMNVYNGIATLNEQGEAVVDLPAYFETLNIDYRYQLTAVGSSMPDLYVSEKVSNNAFAIAGGVANAEVSWQVTGIRNDPYAQQNRIVPEVTKPEEERGKFLNPEVYGKPVSDAIH